MEQTESFETEQQPGYWPSVGMAAFIFAIATTALGLIMGYAIIGGSTGWIFSSIFGVVICLVGAFGGMMAVWHYAREYQLKITLGKGALIGFLTGVVMVVISVVFSEIWQFFDPAYTQKMIESMVSGFEAMDMPQEQIDAAFQSIKNRQTISSQLLWGIPVSGILNLLTGMLGVALFAKKKETDY